MGLEVTGLNVEQEYFTVTNTGDEPISTDGYLVHDEKVHSGKGQRNIFSFSDKAPGLLIEPGKSVAVYSGPTSKKKEYDGKTSIHWANHRVWNDKGDTVYLVNSDKKVISTFGYGQNAAERKETKIQDKLANQRAKDSDSDSDSSDDEGDEGDGSSSEDSDSSESEEEAPRKLFWRNYRPMDKQFRSATINKSSLADDAKWVEDQVKNFTEQIGNESTVVNIAPKRENWDLKRDVQERLETLKKMTQKAIVELIAAKIEKQKAEESSSDDSSGDSDSSGDDSDG